VSDKQDTASTRLYLGILTPVDAANAIRAARLNALDLLDTADILFNLKRYSHSVGFSTLAIEEAAKIALLIMIFLEVGGDRPKLWRAYRNHRAKTAWLNPAIESRVRATFPEVQREIARKIGQSGPTPDELEASKQRAFYSDCYEVSGEFVVHLPSVAEWRNTAWERLCEAQAVTLALRDYPPDELKVWQKHVAHALAEGTDARSVLPELHKELLEKGFVKEGWWDTLLQDAEEEARKDQ
jgi:AbiV family abortive infection protein